MLITVSLAVGILASSQSAFAADTYQLEIQTLLEAKKFDEALILMEQQDLSVKKTYEHRLSKARILSWKGDYEQARQVFDRLMSDYPNNDDVLLASGNLDYYQGNLSAAESVFTSILSRNPDNSDAVNALSNVRKAKTAKRPYKWRIDGGGGVSDFDESDLNDWDNQYLRAEYTPNDVSFHASANRYNRFGITDVEFEAGIASAKRGTWDWGFAAGFTPDGILRPKAHYGGRVGRKVELENGPTLVATLHYRYDEYTEAKIHNISPEVTAYFKNGARLSGRIIGTVHNLEEDQSGWLASGSYPIAKKWKLNRGLAQAPEAVNGEVINTKSIFGGLTYEVSPALDLHVTLARDNREDVYIRKVANVGFTQKF